MSGGTCYKKNKERGAWYELYCIRRTIAGLESRDQDATFEREFYESWIKVPEFKIADKENRDRGLYGVLLSVGNPKNAVLSLCTHIKRHDNAGFGNATHKEGIFETPENRGRGRPKKSGDNLSRSTRWRREKEKAEQGVLV